MSIYVKNFLKFNKFFTRNKDHPFIYLLTANYTPKMLKSQL